MAKRLMVTIALAIAVGAGGCGYGESEQRVYSAVAAFSGRVPDDFVRADGTLLYHDPALRPLNPPSPLFQGSSGRFVIASRAQPIQVIAGVQKQDTMELTKQQKLPDMLVFTYEEGDLIQLLEHRPESVTATLYRLENGGWSRGSSHVPLAELQTRTAERDADENRHPVPDATVARYIQLGKALHYTYATNAPPAEQR